MKQALINLNQRILNLQYQDAKRYNCLNKWSYSYFDKISFIEYGEMYDIVWYGNSSDEFNNTEYKWNEEGLDETEADYENVGFEWFLELLLQYPDKIRSLHFTGPDQGTNGMQEWDFSRLTNTDIVFNSLTDFKVQLYNIGDHNTSIIGITAEEDHKMVSLLLAKMPNIVAIELPTVPDASFFTCEFPKLGSLKLQSGWDHCNFIKNLSQSKILSQIILDFTDVIKDNPNEYQAPEIDAATKLDNNNFMRKALKEAGMTDEEIEESLNPPETDCLIELNLSETFGKPTSFEDYQSLFTAKHLNENWHFKLREKNLTQKQLFSLQEINLKTQFLHIPTEQDYYVSHKIQDEKNKRLAIK
ncbi:MAG: hypothetical protein COA95_04995 [Methylophaga sp.]|nr:MAG: hypothetical protein COA95_04995 [Methylophaga sp.]